MINQSSLFTEKTKVVPYDLPDISGEREKEGFGQLVRLAYLVTGADAVYLNFNGEDLNQYKSYGAVFKEPLIYIDGTQLGFLVVAYKKLMILSPEQKEGLELIAKQAIVLMEMGISKEKDLQLRAQLALQHQQSVDFCNVVSHNLRAPLINLELLVDFIKEASDPEEQKVFVCKMEPVIDELKGTFDDLIESIHIKQETDLKIDEIQIHTCLEESMRSLSAELEKAGGTLEVDFSAMPVLHYPHKYLSSLFFNLISNAIRYNSPDRSLKIRILTEVKGDKVLLILEDNGLGIDLAKHRHNLFKMGRIFHRYPGARGLGLYMTRTQVEAMGGNIWIDSRISHGTKFIIEFANQPVQKIYF